MLLYGVTGTLDKLDIAIGTLKLGAHTTGY